MGDATSGTVVSNGASLVLNGSFGVTNEALVLNGEGTPGWGTLDSETSGTNLWVGPITLNADSTIMAYNAATVTRIIGAIDGPGGVSLQGSGTNYFEGTTANSYGGTTRVDSGTLVLKKPTSVKSVPGNLVVGDGDGTDVVRLESSNQIADTADVTLSGGGVLEMNGYYDAIDELSGSGSLDLGSQYLNIGRDYGSSTFTGVISGAGFLQKYRGGTITLAGNNTYTGMTYVREGKLVINGSQPGSNVQVDYGATLGGSGTIGNLNVDGTVSPGASPGKLNCGNVTFGSAGSLAVELNGNTVGSGYDQLNVVGTVNLTGAALSPPTVGFLPKEGDQFIIVTNDSTEAVTSTFDSGLTEGAVVYDSSYKFSFLISYKGGSGNDVVLIMTNRFLPPGPAMVWSGNGNGAIETNECNLLSLSLSNLSVVTMSGLTATLQSLTPGVVVVQPYSTYPNIPIGLRRTNDALFQITTGPGFVCGTSVNLELQVVSTTHGTLKVPISLPSVCTVGSGICELCPNATLNSALGAASPKQTGRLARGGTASACGSQKLFPNINDYAARSYDAFTFRNGPSAACVMVTLQSPTADVFSAAYTNSFNPASIGANYRADPAGSTQWPAVGAKSYGFTVAANQVFVVTVNEVTAGAGGEYTLSVTGGDCRPALTLSVVRANPTNLELDWSTAATGYQLEWANRLTGAPGQAWSLITTNPPLVADGKFTVTNVLNNTNYFFRLRKP